MKQILQVLFLILVTQSATAETFTRAQLIELGAKTPKQLSYENATLEKYTRAAGDIVIFVIDESKGQITNVQKSTLSKSYDGLLISHPCYYSVRVINNHGQFTERFQIREFELVTSKWEKYAE